MRESLVQSAQQSPGFEQYPKGSVVVCNACGKPIFKLDRAISMGDRSGSSASAFKPLGLEDLRDLAYRKDVDAGIQALLRSWTASELVAHCDKLHEVRSGDPMLCPSCECCFVQVLATHRDEVMDKAYVVELVVIPPAGRAPAIRGRRPDQDWLNESKLVH